jgi:hypothetical protein
MITSATHLQQRLNNLFDYIRQGKIVDAMSEFYDKDTVMQDNANPSTKGLTANIRTGKTVLERRERVERVHCDGLRYRRQRDLL